MVLSEFLAKHDDPLQVAPIRVAIDTFSSEFQSSIDNFLEMARTDGISLDDIALVWFDIGIELQRRWCLVTDEVSEMDPLIVGGVVDPINKHLGGDTRASLPDTLRFVFENEWYEYKYKFARASRDARAAHDARVYADMPDLIDADD